MTYIYHYHSPLGSITLSSNGTELTGLWFDGQKYFGDTLGEEYEEKNLPIFEETARWLDIYFSGKSPDFTPALSMETTPFRKAVWKIMLTIPYGRTREYRKIQNAFTIQSEHFETHKANFTKKNTLITLYQRCIRRKQTAFWMSQQALVFVGVLLHPMSGR